MNALPSRPRPETETERPVAQAAGRVVPFPARKRPAVAPGVLLVQGVEYTGLGLLMLAAVLGGVVSLHGVGISAAARARLDMVAAFSGIGALLILRQGIQRLWRYLAWRG